MASQQENIAQQVRDRIAQSNDVQELIRIYRGFFNPQLGGLAHEVNALAGDKLAQMSGVDRNSISAMHDAEIVQAIQGQGEKRKIEEQAEEQQSQISQFAGEYATKAGEFRKKLAENLARNNQEAFQIANPYILEDLNSRGLFTSPSAVGQAQTTALKELELDRQGKLSAFDTGVFNEQQDLLSGGLSALIGGRQSALSEALNARRAGLNRAYSEIDTQNANDLAQSLAKKQRRNQLNQALIGAGAEIVGSGIQAGALCFTPETEIDMKNGTKKKVSDIWINDETSGGKVTRITMANVPKGHIYDYEGTFVTGTHAVLEGNEWLRVKDSKIAKTTDKDGLVYSLVTENHRLYIGGITFADEQETQYEDFDASLAELNRQQNELKLMEVA